MHTGQMYEYSRSEKSYLRGSRNDDERKSGVGRGGEVKRLFIFVLWLFSGLGQDFKDAFIYSQEWWDKRKGEK
jgi:hypothetical protein